ncbi:CHASE2 and HATPase_c domain-containing protein [uncultured Erythrobacter sp.]|uniref:CHASE2 and HATPase_c domain-containing protein n=1 Tax=uncultured Erythrobacter sp. TaxID=263913 RepID=UPI00261CF567|nr:CHASE2 and HATPase_c domain-containing protein [uncultured Erythrobacter sp.]
MRLTIEWAILLALSVLGAIALQSSEATQRIDNQLLDKVSALARPAFSDDIAIVAIDDTSLEAVGSWPWPRSVHAELVNQLSDAGARLIVLDVLFIEASTPQEDQALADAIDRAGNVVLPHSFAARVNAQTGVDPLMPLAQLERAAAGIGHVAAFPDADGILRRFDLELATDRGAFTHLSVRALKHLDGQEGAATAGTALITFQPEGSIQHQPAIDILDGSFLPELVEGKIVLVGATALGMGDRFSVAAGDVGLMTGVETQANLLNALMTDALIEPISAFWQNSIAAATLVALFIAFWFLPPRMTLYIAIALVAVLLATSIGLLALGQLWLPVAPAIIVILLAYPLWSWRRLTRVSRYLNREAKRMRGDRPAQAYGGMEYVARQVERMRGLIHSIQDSLAFLKQVIEAAPDAMIVINGRGRVEMLNESAAGIFSGWQEMEEPTLDELIVFGGATLQRSGSEMVSEDGRIFLIARAAMDNETVPEFVGEILALREITDLRRLDQERKQMLEFLSHDMRTPQVAIIGLTRKNGHGNGDGSGKSGADTMARIRKQADRTLKLADDFVQLARLESPNLQLEDSDIGALIEEACDRAYVLAEAKQISIEQHLPEEPCFADVDASLIARMLDNLIGNAVKYSPENSVIEVRLEANGGHQPRIIVADNGAGLPEARLKDPFARFGAHATHAGPSAGLGLALVKKVVDAHHGTITVASREGEGTQFTIAL